MDISATTAPDSTQVNADDLIAGPVTVTITDVTAGTDDQPVNIHLAEFPDRAFRPGKSMRRVIIACWGPETKVYAGRRMTLYRDADITFGRDKVGGIRISHLSHIDGPQEIALTESRGKRKPFKVQPLADAPTLEDWKAKIAGSDSIVELRQWWQIATPANRKLIEARVKAIEEAALAADDLQRDAVDSPSDLDPEADKQTALDV